MKVQPQGAGDRRAKIINATIFFFAKYRYFLYILRTTAVYNGVLFSGMQNFSLPAAGLCFSRALGRGARRRRDPPVHHGARVGPGRAPWRVLWALEVAKSGKWQVTMGSLSDQLEPTRPMQTPKNSFFFSF